MREHLTLHFIVCLQISSSYEKYDSWTGFGESDLAVYCCLLMVV